MKNIDLQMHTTASDGKFSPAEVVELAVKKGMRAIAITDHDTVSGIAEALRVCKEHHITLVEGVELSCQEAQFKGTIDVLGLFIDHQSKELNEFIQKCRTDRVIEKREMIEKLNALGYAITFEELYAIAGESLGRPHVAKVLIKKYPEEFSSIEDVFQKLIGDNKKAFVFRKKTSIKEAIDVVKAAHGIAILAHPGRYREFEKVVDFFAQCGGDGIEVDYPYDKILKIDAQKNMQINAKLREIAQQKKLLCSGGSDFHDFERGSEIGDGGVTDEEFAALQKYVTLQKKKAL